MKKNRYDLMKKFVNNQISDNIVFNYMTLSKSELKELLKAYDFYNKWNSGV